MAIVRRANVILRVDDSLSSQYVEQGYDVIDEAGNVIEKSVPRNVGELQKAYREHEIEIASLKAEIKKLKSSKKKAESKKETE